MTPRRVRFASAARPDEHGVMYRVSVALRACARFDTAPVKSVRDRKQLRQHAVPRVSETWRAVVDDTHIGERDRRRRVRGVPRPAESGARGDLSLQRGI